MNTEPKVDLLPCPRCGNAPKTHAYWEGESYQQNYYFCPTGCDNFHEYDFGEWQRRPESIA